MLAIGGRDVADPAGFVSLAVQEHAAIAARGGTLRLKVQTRDAEPQDFAIAGGAAAVTPRGDGKRPPTSSHTGGVNVWDRYGGRTRDDPRQ